jgi:acetyl esterase/lipase
VVYKRIGGLEFTLDLMLPLKKTDEKGAALYPDGSPVAFYFHGGGWRGGNRYIRTPLVKFFSDNGIAVACVSYRFAMNNGVTLADCVTDCFDAVRFVAKNAREYGVDPSRLMAWGHSAGGHLTQMVTLADHRQFPGDPALADAKFRFVGGVSIAGPSTMADIPAWPAGTWFAGEANQLAAFGGPIGENRALAKKVSPYYWLKGNSPRLLLIHGDDDTVVPVLQGLLMRQEARRVGADLTLWLIPGADHGFRGNRCPTQEDVNWPALRNLNAMARDSVGK